MSTNRIPHQKLLHVVAAALALAAGCATQTTSVGAVAVATKRPVVDTYHGVEVVDDYRWLENADDPEVRAWSEAQSARTRSVLDALPHVDAIRRRATELLKASSVSYRGLIACGDKLFAMKTQPPKQQPFLVMMKSPGDPTTERVLLDPAAIDAHGTTAIDFFQPSLDGSLVAVSLSERGSENGTVHCYETSSGNEVGEPIPRVNGGTAGGSVAWNADGTGFYYTRYPRGSERAAEDLDFFQQVYFHQLGTPTKQDRYEIGREFPRIAETTLSTDERGLHVLANVSNGDGGEHAFWVRNVDGAWKQVTKFEDEVVAASLGDDGRMYMLSRKGAPRGFLAWTDTDATPVSLSRATTFVGTGDAAIERFALTKHGVLVVDQLGGTEGVRVFERVRDGFAARGPLALPSICAVDEIVCSGDDILVRAQSFVDPPTWRRFDAVESMFAATALSDTSTVDVSDAEVVREWATSEDGTRVPMTILRPKWLKLDGSNPTLLYGYGGYGTNMMPRFRPILRLWLDQGGVYVSANIRGGGEFGEEWHKAGMLVNKQNVFDDFAACAQRLVELGYSRPERLALQGGSNGGLLMGAMIVQHPELCRAVVSYVGIYDMLRVELTPNGAFNVTEFGTVKNEAQFRALHAYSPYHNVVDGTAYPSVLFMTGANDPRVDPYNSRKMTARLLAANPSGRPVLLRTSSETGHGMGSKLDERVEQEVDAYAFLLHELDVEFQDRRQP